MNYEWLKIGSAFGAKLLQQAEPEWVLFVIF